MYGAGLEAACFFPSGAARFITTFTRSCAVRGSLENFLRCTAWYVVDFTLRGTVRDLESRCTAWCAVI